MQHRQRFLVRTVIGKGVIELGFPGEGSRSFQMFSATKLLCIVRMLLGLCNYRVSAQITIVPRLLVRLSS